MAHTPGPWTVDDCYPASFHNETPPRQEEVWEIMNRDAGITPAYATNREDARLIAAAPDLLAALKYVVEHFQFAPLGIGCIKACDQARAAIKKAEGV
jgi:hypothetical protein